MTEVTRILSAIEQGDPHAAEQLLPLVDGELRKLVQLQFLAANDLAAGSAAHCATAVTVFSAVQVVL